MAKRRGGGTRKGSGRRNTNGKPEQGGGSRGRGRGRGGRSHADISASRGANALERLVTLGLNDQMTINIKSGRNSKKHGGKQSGKQKRKEKGIGKKHDPSIPRLHLSQPTLARLRSAIADYAAAKLMLAGLRESDSSSSSSDSESDEPSIRRSNFSRKGARVDDSGDELFEEDQDDYYDSENSEGDIGSDVEDNYSEGEEDIEDWDDGLDDEADDIEYDTEEEEEEDDDDDDDDDGDEDYDGESDQVDQSDGYPSNVRKESGNSELKLLTCFGIPAQLASRMLSGSGSQAGAFPEYVFALRTLFGLLSPVLVTSPPPRADPLWDERILSLYHVTAEEAQQLAFLEFSSLRDSIAGCSGEIEDADGCGSYCCIEVPSENVQWMKDILPAMLTEDSFSEDLEVVFWFRSGSLYPFESPICAIRSEKASPAILAVSVILQEIAESYVGASGLISKTMDSLRNADDVVSLVMTRFPDGIRSALAGTENAMFQNDGPSARVLRLVGTTEPKSKSTNAVKPQARPSEDGITNYDWRSIRPGSRVDVIQKQDQRTGRMVQGIVEQILTRGAHHRGIKVRLVDGRVGRVQRLFPNPAKAATISDSPVTQKSNNPGKTGASSDTPVIQKSDNRAKIAPTSNSLTHKSQRIEELAASLRTSEKDTSSTSNTALPQRSNPADDRASFSEHKTEKLRENNVMGKNIHPLIRLDTDVLDELSAQETAIEPPELVQTAALDVKPNLADKKEKGTKANNGSPAKDSARASKELLDAFRVQQRTGRYQSMQASRKALPSWQKRDELISALKARHRVIVISGETGCGKTTQVPQYILDHFVETSRGAECKILCTQPRRISAIGVSERVAKERGENLAQTVGYQIRLESKMSEKTRILFCTTGILLRRLEGGFAAAVDSNSDEVGIDEFSHIIIDEVHERSLESDFLLMVLKDLLQIRKDLTVVLMSATLNANLFREYFSNSANDVPHIHMEGRTFPVNSIFLEDVLRDTRYAPPPGSELARRSFATRPQKPAGWGNMNIEDRPADDLPDDKLTLQEFEQRYASLGQDVVRCLGAIDTEKIQYPLIEMVIEEKIRELLGFEPSCNNAQPSSSNNRGESRGRGRRGKRRAGRGESHGSDRGGKQGGPSSEHGSGFKSIPGDFEGSSTSYSKVSEEKESRGILVFLPGYAEIQKLMETLMANRFIRESTTFTGTRRGNIGTGRSWIFPLHSTLSSEEQIRVFEWPDPGCVKVVISTNVAETSITVDDVVFVVDSGKMKETRFDPSKGMASLEEVWVSRASALQRRGRAGRVSEGDCIHMFTRWTFDNVLAPQQIPEIQRTALEQLCLRIKVLPFLTGKIQWVLSKVIEPPSMDAVKAAIQTLQTLRALTQDESLTPLGFHLGRLPVDVRIGKMILFGAIFKCLDPILTIASTLSIKSPFVRPFDKRQLADEKFKAFSTGMSDHLTHLTAYNEWLAARAKGMRAEREFCFANFLSSKTLTQIAGTKRQLAELLSEIGFVKNKIRAREMERLGGWKSDGVALAINESWKDDGSGGASRTGQQRREPQTVAVDDWELIKAVMVAGLYPNVAKVAGENVNVIQLDGSEQVFVHPSSVNWGVTRFPSPFLIFNEKMKTSKVYLRDSAPVSPVALAFFGGKLVFDKSKKLLKMGTGHISFHTSQKVAGVVESARTALDEVLAAKIADPLLDVSESRIMGVIVDVVTDGRHSGATNYGK